MSPGCENCYAERMAARFADPGAPFDGFAWRGKNGPRWTGKLTLVADKLTDPLRWRKPCRIFVNSMSDLFHEALTDEEIAAVFGVMAACPHHTFQVLTKRAERMAQWFEWIKRSARFCPPQALCQDHGGNHVGRNLRAKRLEDVPPWPLRNVWIGVSAEDQQRADERIPHLLRCPAAVRFLSAEPLLGPVRLSDEWLRCPGGAEYGHGFSRTVVHADGCCANAARVDWTIVGGESGPGARLMDLAWARSIVAQCKSAAVPVFVKQLGAAACDARNGIAGAQLSIPQEAAGLVSLRLRDRKGGDMSEWPEDLRIREFPKAAP